MASFGLLKLSCMVLVCFMVITSAPKAAKAAVTCGQVLNNLTPCISYVASGGTLSKTCCNGVQTLYGLAKTTQDRQGVCKCLKQLVNGVSYSSYQLGLAQGLPGKCGVNLPYKISPSTNCDSVK